MMQVNFWLGSLIQMRGEDLFRMKGVIAIRDFPETFVFQVRSNMSAGSPCKIPLCDGTRAIEDDSRAI